jgi:hypothetical protein
MSHLGRLKRRLGLQKDSKVMKGSHKLLKRMRRDHLDVLQNIEFFLIKRYEKDGTIDDRLVSEALKAAIDNNAPQDEQAASIKERLQGIREIRSDVSDDIWRDGLRTVLQSVHRHSSLKPGSRGYLNFVSDFIP